MDGIEFRSMLRKKNQGTDTKPAVMVVDDDELVRAALELALSPNYTVLTCTNGHDALRRLDENPYAVVLDIRMRPVDGLWTYAKIKESARLLPIIFYSAYQDFMDHEQMLEDYKPFAYLTKGDDHDALLRVIRSAVESYQLVVDRK